MLYHLFICRHAQAQMPLFNQPDFDRKLTQEGEAEAAQAGQWLQQVAVQPDIIVCSSAHRTLSTASIIANKLTYNQYDILPYPDLYNASGIQLLNFIGKIDKQHRVVLLVGHNPGVSEVIATLTGTYQINVPTGSVHYLWFEMEDWHSLADGSAQGYRTNI